jgi:hypothetical protein
MPLAKAETLVFWLHAVPNNSALWCIGRIFKKISATPHYATQCDIQAKIFLVFSALCLIAQCLLYLWIYLQIHIHMRKWFNPLISDRSGIDRWKKPRVENIPRLYLYMWHLFPVCCFAVPVPKLTDQRSDEYGTSERDYNKYILSIQQ